MTTNSNPKDASTDWLSSIQSLLGTVVIAVFVITFIVQAFQIPSESMENTLLIGDYLLVDKLCYGGGGFWSTSFLIARFAGATSSCFTIRSIPRSIS